MPVAKSTNPEHARLQGGFAIASPNFLDGVAAALDGWVQETLACSYSSQHVAQMRDQANECRRQAAYLRAELSKL